LPRSSVSTSGPGGEDTLFSGRFLGEYFSHLPDGEARLALQELR
jgi:hypothetical protein